MSIKEIDRQSGGLAVPEKEGLKQKANAQQKVQILSVFLRLAALLVSLHYTCQLRILPLKPSGLFHRMQT